MTDKIRGELRHCFSYWRTSCGGFKEGIFATGGESSCGGEFSCGECHETARQSVGFADWVSNVAGANHDRKGFPGTIKALADAGFQRIELCSPVGYAEFGFGGLAKYKGAEIRKILSDAGVSCESSHFNIKELQSESRGAHCVGKGYWPEADDCAES